MFIVKIIRKIEIHPVKNVDFNEYKNQFLYVAMFKL